MKQPISSEATVKPRPLLGDQLPWHQVERLGEAVLRAVHGAAVVTEQEAADRRHGDDRADEAHVRTLWTSFRHDPLPRPSTVSGNTESPPAQSPNRCGLPSLSSACLPPAARPTIRG